MRRNPVVVLLVKRLSLSDSRAQEMALEKQNELRRRLVADGEVAGPGFITARYNGPSEKPAFRRNEVLVPLEGFKLLEADH